MIDVRLAGRYRLESEIGAGGMTGVWQAVDEVLERPVAVKILHRHLLSNQVFCDRFRKEALAAGALIHPNIVSVYDTGQHDEAPYVVMEYVAGRSPRMAMDLGASAGKPRPQPAHPRDFRPEVPRDLDAAVARALSVSPAERFADAAELGLVLRSVAQSRPARAAISPAPVPPPPPRNLSIPQPPAPPPTGDTTSFVRSEGRWLAPVVLLVLVAIAVVIGVLQLSGKVQIIGGGGSNSAAPPPSPAVTQVPLHAGGTLKPNPPAGDP